MSEKCKAGHVRTKANTYEYKASKNGKIYKTCNICRSARRRLAYRGLAFNQTSFINHAAKL